MRHLENSIDPGVDPYARMSRSLMPRARCCQAVVAYLPAFGAIKVSSLCG